MMRRIYIGLFVFFLALTIGARAYSENKEISREDVISYCGSALDVSSEILEACFEKDYKLLGHFSDGLGALDIIDKIREADDKGAILAGANMASMEFISNVSPVAGGLITCYTAYCKALVIVRDYLFITGLTEDVYEVYKKQRYCKETREEVKPEDVFVNLELVPIEASIKEELLKKKYAKKQITDWAGVLIPKWGDRLEKEAHNVLMARLEERYNKDRAIEDALASKGDVKKSMGKMIKKLKKKLTLTLVGNIFDKETGKPIAGATVRVKGYRIGKLSNSRGFFTLIVPYRIMGDKSFKVGVKKEGYKSVLSHRSYSFKDETIGGLTCYLVPLEEEEDKKDEPVRPHKDKPPSRQYHRWR